MCAQRDENRAAKPCWRRSLGVRLEVRRGTGLALGGTSFAYLLTCVLVGWFDVYHPAVLLLPAAVVAATWLVRRIQSFAQTISS